MKRILILVFTLAAMIQVKAQVNPELNHWIIRSFSYYPKIQELNKNSEISEIRVSVAESNYLPTLMVLLPIITLTRFHKLLFLSVLLN